ncbi:MAG TPA: nicotinate-nucleotide adenylyltransferase [Thermoanaerobaculia bacterium]
MRIGICGGTFDPFHRGHLDPVLAARETMQWDRVLYIPAWRQPFKTHLDAAPGAHRFAMAALAIRDHEALYVSPIELDRGGVSYSVDTLDELHRQFPGASFDWIIGDDNLADLDRWKDPERLFQLARFVVLSRTQTTDNRQPTPANANIVFAHNTTVPISSTEIRRLVRAGEPIDAFVDPLVSRYIHHYGLYKEGQS